MLGAVWGKLINESQIKSCLNINENKALTEMAKKMLRNVHRIRIISNKDLCILFYGKLVNYLIAH